MNPTPNDLLGRLEADCAAAGPPVSDADVARTAAAVKAALATDDGPDLEDDHLIIVPCRCGAAACPECNPPPADLLAAAAAALPLLATLCGNLSVRPIFNALFDAVEKARGR